MRACFYGLLPCDLLKLTGALLLGDARGHEMLYILFGLHRLLFRTSALAVAREHACNVFCRIGIFSCLDLPSLQCLRLPTIAYQSV